MKKLPLFFTTVLIVIAHSLNAQKENSEKTLTNYLLAHCGLSSSQDSTRLLRAVQYINKLYGIKKLTFVRNGTNTSHFYPFVSVLKINLHDTSRICELWGAEMVHAAQFQEQPRRSVIRWLWGGFQAVVGSFFLSKLEQDSVQMLVDSGCKRSKARLWVAYRRQYYKIGSFEYDAHTVREPIIREQILLVLNRFATGIAAR